MTFLFKEATRKSLAAIHARRFLYIRRYISQKSSDPLRILFCGSEDFSIASLRALHDEYTKNQGLIASIDVVCKRAKRIGRNLKGIREGYKSPMNGLDYAKRPQVPISAVAKELSLPLHQIDTFTGWNPPTPMGEDINLIVAVSFGLFVPPRILDKAKYGGLNVHPSMLPDFRGAAPLHHTLLADEKRIGITLQTLHPKDFDQGEILAQTEWPGFEHSCSTVPQLSAVVAPKGADMLVKGLRDRVYVPPRLDLGSWQNINPARALRPAPKITPQDRHIDWRTWTAERILRTQRVIGPLWNTAQALIEGQPHGRRMIWAAGFQKLQQPMNIFPNAGHPTISGLFSNSQSLIIRTCDGHVLLADEVKIEGEATTQAWHAVKRAGMVNLSDDASKIQHDFALFHAGLA